MALNKVTYVDGVTVIGADNLNDIQDAIIANENATDYALAAFPTDTASGSIVSIPDGADGIPVKAMTVQITPSQDLHGYDNPWPAGGGKNVFDQDTILANITSTLQYYPILVGSGNFTMSTNCPLNTNNTANLFLLAGQVSEGASTSINGVWNGNAVTVTAVDDYITVAFRNLYDVNPSDFNSQIEKGSEATSFAPFSNVCPITGWTGCDIYDTGINVWDEQWEVGSYNQTTGAKSTDNTRIRSKNLCRVPKSALLYAPSSVAWVLCYDDNENYLGVAGYTASGGGYVWTTLTNTAYITFYTSGGYGTTYLHNIAINYPSTDTDYHAYNANSTTYTVTFGQTVYGGDADYIGGGKWRVTPIPGYIASYAGETLVGPYISSEAAPDTTPVTGSQVFDYGATPGTPFIVDGPDPETLYGNNNIWADTGDVSVTYRADVGLYIEKKLGA